MRDKLTRILTAITAVLLLCMTSAVPAQAKAKGTETDPFIMTAGKVMHYTWNCENSGDESEGIYNRFTIPADGYVKLTFSRPRNPFSSYYGTYDIIISNASGAEVISFRTVMDYNSADEYVYYKIGLKKGTYLMYMRCNVYFPNAEGAECNASYKYTFTQSAFYETEPNNSKQTAVPMKTGSVYSGEYGEESTADFYSISLKKGIIYQLKMKGELGSSAGLRLISPSGKVKFFNGSVNYNMTSVWTFKADADGKYYFAVTGHNYMYPAEYKVSIVIAPADTLVMIDGVRYLTGSAGKLGSGWRKISGKWYYFSEKGMVKGWKKLSGKWYYFDENNVMVTGWQKISKKQYYFTASGVMVTGWQKIDKKWYYFNAGAMVTGWKKLSGKWYYFDADGVMVTGWQKISNKWYYFNSKGAMHTGWLKDGDWWLYFTSGGTMVRGKKMTIGGKTYEFLSNGIMYDKKLVLTIAEELAGQSGAGDYLVYKLTRYALGMGGASYSRDYPDRAHKVSFSEARPGDLIMYVNTDTGKVPQVGVYLGGYKSFQVVGYDAAIIDLRSIYYYDLYGYKTEFWRIDQDLSSSADS